MSYLLAIENSWQSILEAEFSREYFLSLDDFLKKETKQYLIFPPRNLIFNAFEKTPFDILKVVIIGQDPYHDDGQAQGLAFSVPNGMKFPPSLRNIFKELKNDIHCEIPFGGDLGKWAEQGVLLINETLTVRAHEAGSHQKKGWEHFTDAVIRNISDKKAHVVFILWGNYAQKKEKLIDSDKHYIIKSAHPSPLSANRGGFFGTAPFSKTNKYLIQHGISPIDWTL